MITSSIVADVDAGARDRGADGDRRPAPGARQRREAAEEAADRRARSRNDYRSASAEPSMRRSSERVRRAGAMPAAPKATARSPAVVVRPPGAARASRSPRVSRSMSVVHGDRLLLLPGAAEAQRDRARLGLALSDDRHVRHLHLRRRLDALAIVLAILARRSPARMPARRELARELRRRAARHPA